MRRREKIVPKISFVESESLAACFARDAGVVVVVSPFVVVGLFGMVGWGQRLL